MNSLNRSRWFFVCVLKFICMTKSRILYLVLAIMIGVLMFIYAEVDDSPGGQLLGLIVVIIGIAGLIVSKRKTK